MNCQKSLSPYQDDSNTNPQYTYVEPFTKYPVIQRSFTSDLINNQLFDPLSATGGNLTITDGIGSINITSTIGSYYVLRSKQLIKYREGFPVVLTCSVKFDSNAVVNSLQVVGAGTASNDIYIGMIGSSFGCRVSKGGRHAIRTLTIATNCGNETITITLNGSPFVFAVTTSAILSFTAHKISLGTTFTGYSVQHIGSTIVFSSSAVGSQTGTFSMSSTGTATGTFSTDSTGTALTTSNVLSTSFNGNPSSIRSLNPFEWNTFQIEYYYSQGNANFYVLDEDSNFKLIHSFRFKSSPNFSASDMFLQRLVASVGSTTALSMQTTDASVYIGGALQVINRPRYSVNRSSVLAGNIEEVVLCIQHRLVLNGIVCIQEILLNTLSISTDGTKAVLVKFILNPTTIGANTSGDYDVFSYVDQTYSQTLYDNIAVTYTGGTNIFQTYLDKVSTNQIDLTSLKLFLGRNDTLLVTALSTNASDILCSMTFVEDI